MPREEKIVRNKCQKCRPHSNVLAPRLVEVVRLGGCSVVVVVVITTYPPFLLYACVTVQIRSFSLSLSHTHITSHIGSDLHLSNVLAGLVDGAPCESSVVMLASSFCHIFGQVMTTLQQSCYIAVRHRLVSLLILHMCVCGVFVLFMFVCCSLMSG